MRVIFPCSYLHPTQVDEDLVKEYEGAVEAGCEICLFDYDKWVSEEKLVLRNAPEEECIAVYRGWMLKPDQYKQFYHRLIEEHGIQLVTSPDCYERMHVFPNVYPYIRQDTAQILTYSFEDDIQIDEVRKHFPRFMVKDFTKSVKGTSFPKYFDDSYTQEEFDEQMQVFYQYRGKLLTGGICIKEYLDWGNASKEEMEDYLIQNCDLDEPLSLIRELESFRFYDDEKTKERAAGILRENGIHIVLEDDETIVLNNIYPPCNFEVSDYWQGYEFLKNNECTGGFGQLWLVDAVRMIEEQGANNKTFSQKETESDDEMKKNHNKVKRGFDYLEKLRERRDNINKTE